MENTNTKWLVAGLGMTVILLLFSVTKILGTGRNDNSLDDFLRVSMPRPIKELILGLSFQGRNVIREIEEDNNGNPHVTKKAVVNKVTGAPTQPLVDKGQAQKAKAANLARLAKAQAYEKRRQAFQARVIEQAERYRRSLNAQAIENSFRNTADEYANWSNTKMPNTGKAQENPDKNKEKSNTKTSAEWKSLILTQPTDANISLMIKAYADSGIDAETYLEISESLIKDNSQEKRKMGLRALTGVYRQEAFTLASHLVLETDTPSQKILNDYMYSYNRSQTLAILDQVLKSSDVVAATASAQAITKAIQSIKATTGNNQAASGRGDRASHVQQLTLSSYQRFIPTLKIVVSKNLNNLSQWAQNLLSQLQSSTTTA